MNMCLFSRLYSSGTEDMFTLNNTSVGPSVSGVYLENQEDPSTDWTLPDNKTNKTDALYYQGHKIIMSENADKTKINTILFYFSRKRWGNSVAW